MGKEKVKPPKEEVYVPPRPGKEWERRPELSIGPLPTPPDIEPTIPIPQLTEQRFRFARGVTVPEDYEPKSFEELEKIIDEHAYVRDVQNQQAMDEANRWQKERTAIVTASLPQNEIARSLVAGTQMAMNRVGGSALRLLGQEEYDRFAYEVNEIWREAMHRRAQTADNVLPGWMNEASAGAISNIIEVMVVGPAAIPYFGYSVYRDSYHEAIDMGYSPEQAKAYAMDQGMLEAGIALAVQKITGLKGFEGMGWGGQRVIGKGLSKAAIAFSKEFGVELFEEFITEALQQLNTLRLKDPTATLADVDWPQLVKQVSYATFVMMAGGRAMNVTMNQVAESIQRGEIVSRQTLEKMIDKNMPSPEKSDRVVKAIDRIVSEQFRPEAVAGEAHGAPIEVAPEVEPDVTVTTEMEGVPDAKPDVEEAARVPIQREGVPTVGEAEAEARRRDQIRRGEVEAVPETGGRERAGLALAEEEEAREVLAEPFRPDPLTVAERPSTPANQEIYDRAVAGDEEAIDTVAGELATEIDRGEVLVPLPDAAGDTTGTRRIAEAMTRTTPETTVIDAWDPEGIRGLPEGRPVTFVAPEYSPEGAAQARQLSGEPEAKFVAWQGAPESAEAMAERRYREMIQDETNPPAWIEKTIMDELLAKGIPGATAQSIAVDMRRRAEEAREAPAVPEVAPPTLEDARRILDRYEEGGITTVQEVAEQLEAMEGLPADLVEAVETYRREAEHDRRELGLRGDVEAYEGALMSALEAAVAPAPERAPAPPAEPVAEAAPEAPPAPERAPERPVAPERAPEAPPRRRRIPETPEGPDILNVIEEQGRIATKPKRYKGGEYDGRPSPGGYGTAIMSRDSDIRPDQMAALLQERGFGDGTTNTMWEEIRRAINERRARKGEEKARIEAEREQEREVRVATVEVAPEIAEEVPPAQRLAELEAELADELGEPLFEVRTEAATGPPTVVYAERLARQFARFGRVMQRPDGSVVLRAANGELAHFIPQPVDPAQPEAGGSFQGLFMSPDGTVVGRINVYPNQLTGTYGHEVVHWMRAIGLITDQEFDQVVKEGLRRGLGKAIDVAYAEAYRGMDPARRREALREEVMAVVIEQINDGRLDPGDVGATTLWDRIKLWIDDMLAFLGLRRARRRALEARERIRTREAVGVAERVARGEPLAREPRYVAPVRREAPPARRPELEPAFQLPTVEGQKKELFTPSVMKELSVSRSAERNPTKADKVKAFFVGNESIRLGVGESISSLVDDYVSNRIPNLNMRKKVVRTSDDAAVALAAIRSPFVETTAWIVADAEGRIVDQQIHGIGAIDEVAVPTKAPDFRLVQDVARRAGPGSTVYFAHNHPSGNIEASVIDRNVIKRLASDVGIRGIKFVGLILNGNQYNYYSAGEWTRRRAKKMPVKTWEAVPATLRPKITSPDSAFDAAIRIKTDENSFLILALDAGSKIIAVKSMASLDLQGMTQAMTDLNATSYILTTQSREVYGRIGVVGRGLPRGVKDVIYVDVDKGDFASMRRDDSARWAAMPEMVREPEGQYMPRSNDPALADQLRMFEPEEVGPPPEAEPEPAVVPEREEKFWKDDARRIMRERDADQKTLFDEGMADEPGQTKLFSLPLKAPEGAYIKGSRTVRADGSPGAELAPKYGTQLVDLAVKGKKGSLTMFSEYYGRQSATIDVKYLPPGFFENLAKWGSTSWGVVAARSMLARATLLEAMDPRAATTKNTGYVIPKWAQGAITGTGGVSRQAAALLDAMRFDRQNGFFATASKPELAIPQSQMNCDPSNGCVQDCYSVTNPNQRSAASIMFNEIMDIVAQHHGYDLGTFIAEGFKTQELGAKGYALRMADRGEGGDHWVPVVKGINERGVRLHVFSKRPEYLKKLAPMNLRLLSIDRTNLKKAAGNKLRIAYRWNDRNDLKHVKALSNRIQAILPTMRRRTMIAKDIDSIPEDLAINACPADMGRKLGRAWRFAEPGTPEAQQWSCPRCDHQNQGCYHNSTTASVMPQQQISALVRDLADAMERGGLTIDQANEIIRAELDNRSSWGRETAQGAHARGVAPQVSSERQAADRRDEADRAENNPTPEGRWSLPINVSLNPLFFNKAEVVVGSEKMPTKGTGDQMLAFLRNNGVSQRELYWSGLETLKGKKGVTKEMVQGLLRENGVIVSEVEGGNQYTKHTIPGGQDYREMLITADLRKPVAMEFEDWWESRTGSEVPTDAESLTEAREQYQEALRDDLDSVYRDYRGQPVFQSTHWGEQNVIVHTRYDSRETPDGQPVTFLQEIQSDWHQEGRRRGYYSKEDHLAALRESRRAQEGLAKLSLRMDSKKEALENKLLRDLEAKEEQGIKQPTTILKLGRYEIEVGRHWVEHKDERLPTYFTKDAPIPLETVGNPGFFVELLMKNYLPAQWQALDDAALESARARNRAAQIGDHPEAGPFNKTWDEVGLRRMIRQAVDDQKAYLAWANGPDIAEKTGGPSAAMKKFYSTILVNKANKILKQLAPGQRVRKIKVERYGVVEPYESIDADTEISEQAESRVSFEYLTDSPADRMTAKHLKEVSHPDLHDEIRPGHYVVIQDGEVIYGADSFQDAVSKQNDLISELYREIAAHKVVDEYNAIEITPEIRMAVQDGQPLAYSLPVGRDFTHDAGRIDQPAIKTRFDSMAERPQLQLLSLTKPFDEKKARQFVRDPVGNEAIAAAIAAVPLQDPWWKVTWDWIKSFLSDFRRTYKELDEVEYAEAIEELKILDNEMSIAPVAAARQVRQWVKGMNDEEYVDFTLGIALPDVIRELENDEDGLYADNPGGIPFYGMGEEETRSVAEIRSIIERDLVEVQQRMTKRVKEAIAEREQFHEQFTEELVEAGLLNRDVLKDNRYFHRIVLQYMDGKQHMGKKGIRVRKVPAQFKRVGGGDFSLNFMVSEMDYMASMRIQLAKMHAMARINELHGKQQGLKQQARYLNDEAMAEWWDEQVRDAPNDVERLRMVKQGWDYEWRKNIAINSQWLVKQVADGAISGTPFPALEDAAVSQLGEWEAEWEDVPAKDREPFRFDHPDWFAFLHYLGSGQHGPIWVAKGDDMIQENPSLNALGIFKSIADRERFKKDTLKGKYHTWQTLAQTLEDHKLWQPKEGLLVVPGFSVTDKQVSDVLAQAGVSCDEDVLGSMPDVITVQTGKIKRSRMVVGLRPQWVLPAPIVDQLNRMEGQMWQGDTRMARALESLNRAWKPIILFGPWRWLRYEFNNMSGDLDAALSHPGVIKEVPAAMRDLWSWANQTRVGAAKGAGLFSALVGSAMGLAFFGPVGAVVGIAGLGLAGAAAGAAGFSYRRQEMVAERMRQAERLGILSSGMLINEVKKGRWQEAKELITGEKAVKVPTARGYYRSVRAFNTWREGILRIAAARYFWKKLGGLKPWQDRRFYGASRKDVMDKLYDRMQDLRAQGEEDASDELKEQIAAKLSRELLGDYGSISESGRFLRRSLAPFWAWQEVNTPRYVRLVKNARYEGGNGMSRGVALGAAMTIKTGIAISALSVMIMAWNAAIKAALDIPDEEDPNVQRGRGQYVILGKREDGSIKTIKFSGALMDALGWTGADDFRRHVENVRRADARGEVADGIMQVAADVGMAPVQRLADITTPLAKAPAEIIAGEQWYPDIRRPRKIRDRGEYLASLVGLRNVYKAWNRTANIDQMFNAMVYDFTPGAGAYWRGRQLGYEFADREYSREHTFALIQAKSAWAYGDPERAKYWMNQYWQLGGTWKGYKASMARGHPLAPVRKKDRERFWSELTEEDKRLLQMGIKWWETQAAGAPEFDAMAEQAFEEYEKTKPVESE